MIVGFGHVARSGKDTAALALCRDLAFTQRQFAGPLKRLAYLADPIVVQSAHAMNIGTGAGRLAHIVDGLNWDGAKDVYPEVRTFLQNLGVGAREIFGQDFWVEQAMADMKGDVVFADVRFENEAEAILAAGGIVLKVSRPGRTASGHISETELANWEGWTDTIENTGSVVDLESAVVAYVKESFQWITSRSDYQSSASASQPGSVSDGGISDGR